MISFVDSLTSHRGNLGADDLAKGASIVNLSRSNSDVAKLGCAYCAVDGMRAHGGLVLTIKRADESAVVSGRLAGGICFGAVDVVWFGYFAFVSGLLDVVCVGSFGVGCVGGGVGWGLFGVGDSCGWLW